MDQEELEIQVEYMGSTCTIQELLDYLFRHVSNLQQFMSEKGYSEVDFKEWLDSYEKRGMN